MVKKPAANIRIGKLLEWLVNEAKEIPTVQRIYLFGSQSRDDATITSDIDLAVDMDSKSAKDWDMVKEKVENNPITLLPVDLILLSRAGKNLKAKILKEGKLLYERKD